MLATEFLHGQGMGNQLFAYVTTRVLALRLGYDFGIKGLQSAGDSRVNKKQTERISVFLISVVEI
jgi:hypothetical protein